ncbi:hypothetical protein HK098_002696 [Nowakowskiella sp. JEL0407]|nr:hypothetical protein HK098_002696 [Nowakowskiella sp. JEL0407]
MGTIQQPPVVVNPNFGSSPTPVQKAPCAEYAFCFFNLTVTENTQNAVNQSLQNPYFLGGSACAVDLCPQQSRGDFGTDERNFFTANSANGCLYGRMAGAKEKAFYTLTKGAFRQCPEKCMEALYSSIPEKECGPTAGGDSLNVGNPVKPDVQSGGNKSAPSKLPNGVSSGNSNDNTGAVDPGGSNIGLIAAVIAGVAVLLIVGLGAFFIYRRRQSQKSQAVQTLPRQYTHPQPNPPIPMISVTTAPPALAPLLEPPPIPTGFVFVASLNVASLNISSTEQSILDEIEAHQDLLHRLASTIITNNPNVSFIPGVTVNEIPDFSSKNLSFLKSLMWAAIQRNIYSTFTNEFLHSFASMLWQSTKLQYYAHSWGIKVSQGLIQLEAEVIYEIILDLLGVDNNFNVVELKELNYKNRVTMEQILNSLSRSFPVDQVTVSALEKVVLSATTTAVKLLRCDATYKSFFPGNGEAFDPKRMKSLNSEVGDRVEFAWGVGWEKTREDGALVKFLANVWRR